MALSDAYSVENLLKRFEDINNFIYANEGLSPQHVLDEFLKILYIKIYDENNNLSYFNVSPTEYALSECGKDSALNQRISLLFSQMKEEFSEIFDNDEKINLSNKTLCYTINKLQNIKFGESSNDAKGIAFQKILTRQDKVGRGQYFTPEPVIDFCIKLINPKMGETVIDPCCGSGGFLYAAYNHIRSKNNISKEELIKNYLFGIDISKSITRISKMKFLLESNIKNNIYCYNSLVDLDIIYLLLDNKLISKGFDVLLTNPPFGTAGKIMDMSLLQKYDLGYKWEYRDNEYHKTRSLQNGQPAEILFIERCLHLLKENGRMAIILPNGHFENPSLGYLRNYIKKKARILGVISLPQETFIPYGTGVKTSVLLLQKQTLNGGMSYPIFMGKINKIGYNGNKNGTPVYKKDEKGNIIFDNGEPLVDADFSSLISDFLIFNKYKNVESINSYSINCNLLKDRLDYDYYAPINIKFIKNIKSKSVRLGDIVDIVKKKSQKLKDKSAEVAYVELSDINAHSLEIINSNLYRVYDLPSRASYDLEEGDIITAVAGNSVGTKKHATALVSKEYSGAICTNGFRVLRNARINPYYLIYYFKTDMFLTQMKRFRTGAAIPNVSDNDLADVLIYKPTDSDIEHISELVKKSFDLRYESSKLLESICISYM